VKPRLRGQASEIRFADDAILCFQYREDAEKVKSVLSKRFAKYGLTLHPEKTRLVELGRYAEGNAKRKGKKPGTFDFLGFTHICTRSRQGKFTVHVGTMRKRLRRGLSAVAQWCQEHRHEPVVSNRKSTTPSSGATTSIMADRRTIRVSGSSIGVSGISGGSGSIAELAHGGCRGRDTQDSCANTPCCYLGSCLPGRDSESCLKNPLREIRTAGSERGETPGTPWWT